MSAAEVQYQFNEFKNASLANFSVASDRKKMEEALAEVRSQLGRSYSLKDGSVLASKTEKAVASYNPAKSSEVVGFVEHADEGDVESALAALSASSASWKKTDVLERSRMLERLADWMESHRWELSAWMVFEVAKDWRTADADTCEAIDFCRYYAREAVRLFEPHLTQRVQGEQNILTYQPRGVSVVIAPWNFPLAILTGMSVASLVTGNTTVIKPAEQSSVMGALLAQGLLEAGFPQESFYFLPADGELFGPKLVTDPRVDMIVFTGSVNVGLSIIESAAKKPAENQRGVKRVVAEMGGKNALIIDDDADLDEAVIGAIHSAFGFQGQKCSALSRLLVHEKVYESFVERFIEATKALHIGGPEDPKFHLGPVIDQEAQERIERTISESQKRLKTLYVAEQKPSEGFFVRPAVFEVESRDDSLFQNEIFGPVVAVKKIHSLEEGIEDMNSVRFALTGGLYSRNPSNIEKVKREADVGNLYINRGITGAVVQRQPFGGFKLSGVGSKAGGPDYLLQFVEPRTITENTVRRGFAGD